MYIYKALFAIVILSLPGCTWFDKTSARETIFDRIVSIPKDLILDVPYLPPLCDELAGLKKEFIGVDQGKLYCEQEGRGIPLLLINGGPGGTHHVFHPYFSQAKDFAHLIYYDQHGTGKSSTDETGATYTIRQAVEDIENLRKELKIDKWAVLGWSYGGFLAQCYALTHPEHVLCLILVAASDGLQKVTMKPGRDDMFITKAEHDAIGKIYASKDLNKLQIGYNKDLAGDWKRQGYYKPTPKEFIRATRYEWSPAPGFRHLICQDMNKISLDGKFDDFEIPTLLVEAKWDLTWDTDKAAFMRKNHPHAQFEYFEKSGHCIFGDEPAKFFPMLKNFLQTSSKQQITYKQGNRLTWPKPAPDLVRKLAVKGGNFSDYYEQAIKDNIQDYEFWTHVVDEYIRTKKEFTKCLTALQKIEDSFPAQWQDYRFCIITWQGHMLDLLGQRDQAIQRYKEALKIINDKQGNFFGSGMMIDKQWIQDRLKTPFKW